MTATAAGSLRLFIGLWPPPELLAELETHTAAWSWTPGARRTQSERLHATLHFLGEVPAAGLPALRAVLDVRWPGCELVLDRAGVWPGGTAVLETSQVPPELAALHAALGERLRALQFSLEARRYRPHVTLARKAFGARPPAQFAPLAWQVGPQYFLVQSLPGGRGYLPLQRFG